MNLSYFLPTKRKMNKCNKRINMDSFKHLVSSHLSFLITTHKSPDGDAIGSASACYFFLKNLGKEAIVLLPDSPADFLIPFLQNVNYRVYDLLDEQERKELLNREASIHLDYNSPSRVGEDMKDIFKSLKGPSIMIDHHPNPSIFTTWSISKVTSSSTAELFYEILENNGLENHVDMSCARGIYLGMMTDTGSFRFPSVCAYTHHVLERLLALGLNHVEIHEAIYDDNTVGKLQLRGFAIAERMELIPNTPIGIITLSGDDLRRFNYKKGDTEGLVNVVLSIKGIHIALFAVEKEGGVKMSFRSKGTYYVNEFASNHFNGGGHKYAAGGESKDSLDVTISRFKSLLHELL